MANIHEDNESCKERMKEFIRKGFDRTEVIREVKKEFLNVNNDTFYRWYDSVILEQDIKEWEKENEKQHKDQLQDFTDLKRLIYLRNKNTDTVDLYISYEASGTGGEGAWTKLKAGEWAFFPWMAAVNLRVYASAGTGCILEYGVFEA